MTEQLERFRKSIESFLSDWESIDVRLLALPDKNDNWLLSAGRISFDSRALSKLPRPHVSSVSGLKLHHEILDIRQLDSVMEPLRKGKFDLGALGVIRFGSNGNLEAVPHYTELRRNRPLSLRDLGVDRATMLLRWSDTIRGSLLDYGRLDELDDRLRSADPPWDGLRDLRRNFVGLRGTDFGYPGDAGNAILDVVAPLPVALRSWGISGKSVVAEVEYDQEGNLPNASISAIAELPGKETQRLTLPCAKLERKQDLQGRFVEAQVELRDEPRQATVFLMYRDRQVQVERAYGKLAPFENPRLVVMQSVTDGLKELRARLLDRASKGKPYENLVALLLHAAGFATAHYGQKPWKVEVGDIVAFPPFGRWVLVAECTTATDDMGAKISMLIARAKQLEADCSLPVCPVLFVLGDQALVSSTDKQAAGRDKVSVVTSTEIPTIIDRIADGTTADDIRDYLMGLIPPDGSLQRSWR